MGLYSEILCSKKEVHSTFNMSNLWSQLSVYLMFGNVKLSYGKDVSSVRCQ